jgi:DNA adenine methylase
MKYMGSKTRISKYILPIMLKERDGDSRCWVEPFVGGGNMIDKVTGWRIGADFNPYVIQALIDIRDFLEFLPKNNREFTEDNYKQLRHTEIRIKGYAGFAFSYSGKWLGGWCRGDASDGTPRDYVEEAYKNAVRQSALLQGVKLVCCSYHELEIPSNSVVYCDPPYQNTTSYKNDEKNPFCHDSFWGWCREQSGLGHTMFVSEYDAPSDFQCVWEGRISSSLTKDTGSKVGVERLFTI